MLRSPLPDVVGYTAALKDAMDVDVASLVPDEDGTICNPEVAGPNARHSLPVLMGEGASEILVKRSLSRGGMGEILLAEQWSIGREVAVKIVSAKKGGTLAEAELVVEARVAGQLEHPNIVPIHVLGMTTDGKPLIVMKRVEGVTWKDLLKEGRQLARDVEILMDVCRALHFAHARGVVHRDVKPANVMVGSFGEVYLLDWGIAIGFGESTLEDLPHARDVTSVSGTPQYMAPEMAFPEGRIDQRTDVYLAGAALFEVMKGSAPHLRGNVDETLFAAHTAAEPVLPDDAPEELVAICKKAMKRDPSERFQSAEDMRRALATFQAHAIARDLCTSAEEQLARLLALPADATDAVVQRTFTDCRFDFATALRAWPESTRAHEGLARAVEVMAGRALAAGHYDSARLFIAELERPPPALVEALAALRDRRALEAKNVAELERQAHERDLRTAERERALIVWGSALSWLILLVGMDVLARADVFHAASGTFAIIMGSLIVTIAVAGIAVPRLRATSASRSLLLALWFCVFGIATIHVVCWHFGIPKAPALAAGHTVLALSLLTLAAQDARLWLGALLTATIVPAILLAPSQVYLVSGIGCFIALSAFSWRWRSVSSRD